MNNKTRFVTVFIVVALGMVLSCGVHAGSETLPPVINEVQSSNATTMADRDGDYSDWIELFNPGTAPVNLAGYGLSDNRGLPYKWVFPEWVIPGGRHMLVFASGKDVRDSVFCWETVIDQGDVWHYLIPTSEPPSSWSSVDFNDSGWATGPSGFGDQDGDDATELAPSLSLYLRKTFTVEDVSNITAGYLHIDFDDAFVAYLNGREIARSNTIIGKPPLFNRPAFRDVEAVMYTGSPPAKTAIANVQSYLVEGRNVLAIQVHNSSAESDMTAIPFLTFRMSRPPAGGLGLSTRLPVGDFDIRHFHTNFKVSSGGETLTLTDPSGTLCDEVQVVAMGADRSYGRQPDGAAAWVMFPWPTPGSANNTKAVLNESVGPVTASHSAGLYRNPIVVALSASVASAVIRYTLDGSVPTESSNLYVAALPMSEPTVLRARAYVDDVLPGETMTSTYIITDRALTLPVVSLSSDSANLFDPKIGIYHTDNIMQDWERPVHVELFEPDGSLGFSIDAGMELFGKSTRRLPQKSFGIFARQKYGTSSIEYPIFPDLPISSYSSFVLRNGGTDNTANEGGVHFRDGLVATIVSSLDLDEQAYRPAIGFINGRYWGIYNIREKINEEYLEAHHGVDPDSVDILDDYHTLYPIVVKGDAADFNALIDYLKGHDLAVREYADYAATKVSVTNYIDYMASQIWYVNHDGPGHNSKFWRPRTPEGRYRWILFDTDHSFSMRVFIPGYRYDREAYKDNTIAYYRQAKGPSWPNPPESTFLFRKILENEGFRHLFINRLCDLMNSIYSAEAVGDTISRLRARIEGEMPYHLARWGGSMDQWRTNVGVVERFPVYRNEYLRGFIQSEFGLDGPASLELRVSEAGSGRIKLNSLTLDRFPWTGTYFQGVPIALMAVPEPGYAFTGWTGAATTSEQSVTVLPGEITALTAHFEKKSSQPPAAVVINEINYSSADDFDPDDWVELHNAGDAPVDLGGWVFKDEDDAHAFTLPESTVVAPGGFVVMCRDSSAFAGVFPEVTNFVGDFGFGLANGGETLRLFDLQGTPVDSLTYDDQAPWPPESDGAGPTLSLRDPGLDNSAPGNWAPSSAHGTPGRRNEIVTAVEQDDARPHTFELGQNTPNPFNSATVIPFSLPQPGRATIRVYSILGQEVAVPVDGRLGAGSRRVTFSAGDLTSGIYFYRLTAGKQTQIRRMVCIK